MRIETTVEVERENEETGQTWKEPTRLVADTDGDDVRIVEPTDYRYLTRYEQTQLFDAACDAIEREEKAAARSKELVDDFLNTALLQAEVSR